MKKIEVYLIRNIKSSRPTTFLLNKEIHFYNIRKKIRYHEIWIDTIFFIFILQKVTARNNGKRSEPQSRKCNGPNLSRWDGTSNEKIKKKENSVYSVKEGRMDGRHRIIMFSPASGYNLHKSLRRKEKLHNKLVGHYRIFVLRGNSKK